MKISRMDRYYVETPDKKVAYGIINRINNFYRAIGKREEISLKVEGRIAIVSGIGCKCLEKIIEKINNRNGKTIWICNVC